MSRGSPDFIGIRSFPLYGPFTTEYQYIELTATGTQEIFNLSGKGYVFSGHIYIETSADAQLDYLTLKLDGDETQSIAALIAWQKGVERNRDLPLSLAMFRESNQNVSFFIGGGMTFEETFVLELNPASDTLRKLYTNLYYAKVG